MEHQTPQPSRQVKFDGLNTKQPSNGYANPVPKQQFRTLSPSTVLALQGTIGNRGVQRLLKERPMASRSDTQAGNVQIIQRRLSGTASALSHISEGSGKVLKDKWKKTIEAVQKYEALEASQPMSGNLKARSKGFAKLLRQLRKIRGYAIEWIRENADAVDEERKDYAAKEFDNIIANAGIEKSNKTIAEQNRRLLPEQQQPLIRPSSVTAEPVKSQQLGALKSLLLRLTVEEPLLVASIKDPIHSPWTKQADEFSDATLQNGHVDNAVGGAMNSLDKGTWQQQRGQIQTGYFIKEKSIDALTEGTGAQAIGIPSFDPNYAGRSLAMARIDALISDKINDFRKYGVHASDSPLLVNMQLAVHKRETAKGSGQFETKMGIMSEEADGAEFRSGFVESGNTAMGTQDKANMGNAGRGKLALDDPALQRGLNKLQLLDAICGQVDRHLANIYVKTDATGAVMSVKGIDNDMAFGAKHGDLNDQEMQLRLARFAWRGLPPIADFEMAMAIRNLDAKDLREALEGLISQEEIEMTIRRFTQVKEFLQGLPTTALIKHDEWTARKEEIAATQTADNSYLGTARNEALQAWFVQNRPSLIQSLEGIISTGAALGRQQGIVRTGAHLIVDQVQNFVADGRFNLDSVQTKAQTIAQQYAGLIKEQPDMTLREMRWAVELAGKVA